METNRQVMNNNKGRKHKQQGPQQIPQTHSQGQQAKDNKFQKEGETTQRQEGSTNN